MYIKEMAAKTNSAKYSKKITDNIAGLFRLPYHFNLIY